MPLLTISGSGIEPLIARVRFLRESYYNAMASSLVAIPTGRRCRNGSDSSSRFRRCSPSSPHLK